MGEGVWTQGLAGWNNLGGVFLSGGAFLAFGDLNKDTRQMMTLGVKIRVIMATLCALMGSDAVIAGSPAFPYYKFKIDDHSEPTSLALGPDGHLYVSNLNFGTEVGTVTRYRLDESGRYTGQSEVVVSLNVALIQGIAFDPSSTSSNLVLWVSHNGGQEPGEVQFNGTISKVTIPAVGMGGSAVEETYIDGLPVGAHAPNGIAFGPDGRLYMTCGSMTPFGGTQWGLDETLISATILVADVNAPGFGGGTLPVNVKTTSPNNYNPYTIGAPVEIFVTGIRNMYDMAWHSNGELYGCINQGSYATAMTPSCGGAPAIHSQPAEVLVMLEEGAYYGHPNPNRNECVLNGGNPTAGVDPWEITEYPVGISPDADFDPSLVIRNVLPDGGRSPNGIAEYVTAGPLQNRLLIANFIYSRTIQSYALDGSGLVTDADPLRDFGGTPITFIHPLDVVVHPDSGRVYVADFGEWDENGGDGTGGAVWVLDPLTACKCGDLDAAGAVVDLSDFHEFADCLGVSPATSQACVCADSNADGQIDLRDFASLTRAFDQTPTNSPPNCP